jgi:metallo-beta-lactamase family protein
MKLTFWGAAQQVTGSMFLLELEDDYRILIDCGFDMERERIKKNGQAHQNGTATTVPQPTHSIFPFEPSMINVVLLTHAHIDHSGNIPNLFREGYEGQVLCTSPTYDLSELLLMDSAGLHRRKLNAFQKKKKKKKPSLSPTEVAEMYLEKNVKESLERFVSIPFNKKFKLKQGVEATFNPAGHLLGAANIILEITENGEKKSIAFSGDIGRYDYPLHIDPQPLPQVDYLICESTYGNRRHDYGRKSAIIDAEERLSDIIQKTCVDIPGRLVIPAFSVGRTQALLYTLNKLYVKKQLPPLKVFSDSPLAHKSTETYSKYSKYLNNEAQKFQQQYDDLFDFENLEYVEDLKSSKEIANYNQPCIIISSSGMIEGGRVQYHVRTNLSNPYSTILMIGFAAEGTLGHRLLMGEKVIRIDDKEVAVLANIARIDAFSGHGDLDDLLGFVKQQNKEHLKKVFLVHGETESMDNLKTLLTEDGYQVEIPKKGERFDL